MKSIVGAAPMDVGNYCKSLCAVLPILWGIANVAHAYERATHAHITQAIYERSSVPSNLTELTGIYASDVLGGTEGPWAQNYYYDFTSDKIYERYAINFSLNRMPGPLKLPESYSAQGWLMRGAIREDDVPWYAPGSTGDRDPYGSYAPPLSDHVRPLNHFYDPVKDRALTVGIAWGKKAPNWGLGTMDFTTIPLVPDTGRRNHFSIFDAREAMFRAVTGESSAGSTAIVPDGAGNYREPYDIEEAEQSRKAYWATTFRALGDVLHLIEDMAQPQHTRNDEHVVNGALDRTIYEVYTEARATQTAFTCGNGNKVRPPKLTFKLKSGDYYPIAQFNNYSDYFSYRPSHTGMADFSNSNFYTAGTNVANHPDYLYPDDAKLHYAIQRIVNPCIPTNGAKEVQGFFYGNVTDHEYSNTIVNPKALSAIGIYDQSTIVDDSPPPPDAAKITLAAENYKEMADVLIPRAVGYGAGFLNYFFRGRLDIEQPDDGVYAIVDHAVVNSADDGFRTLKVKIRNVTPAVVLADGTKYTQNMGDGYLYAVVRYHRNPCYKPDLSGEWGYYGERSSTLTIPNTSGCSVDNVPTPVEEIAVSKKEYVAAVTSSDYQTIKFDFSNKPIPLNATDVYLEIVFRGKLGTENEAVVVATKDISEPTYVSVTNSLDYIGVNGALYTKAQIEAAPTLAADVDQNGNNNGVLDENLTAGPIKYVRIGFAGPGPDIVEKDTLGVDESIRVSVLQDVSSAENTKISYDLPSGLSVVGTYNGLGRVNQKDEASGVQVIDGIDFYDNQTWVGPFRGFHHDKGEYVLSQRYDPDHKKNQYAVEGLTLFDAEHLMPVAVDRILDGY